MELFDLLNASVGMKMNDWISNINDGETLELEEGRYFIDRTIEIKDKKNIIIKGKENVVFDGGIVINLDKVKTFSGNIKVVDLSEYNITLAEYGERGFGRSYINAPNELFINGKPYHVSQYPKNDYFIINDEEIVDSGSDPSNFDFSNRPFILKFNDEKICEFCDEEDLYIAGYFKHSWADDCISVAKIDKEHKTITSKDAAVYSVAASGHARWKLLNCFAALSESGEYYIDRKNKKLYFICDEEIELIQLSVLDEVMVAIENCENIKISGITFENSRNSGVYIENGEKCEISDCVFRNLGVLGVQMGKGATPIHGSLSFETGDRAEGVEEPKPASRIMGSWNQYIYQFSAWDNDAGFRHCVKNCKIYNTGAGGILLSGGNRKKLIPGECFVYNCEIYSVNRLDTTYKPGIHIMGVGNKIAHCEIYDISCMGILLHGNDHIIEFNKIHDVMKVNSDCGAIYMGRNMSEVGNVFRNNFIYNLKNPHPTDLGVCAIYFDDWDIFNAVYDNFFYNIQGGGFCVVHHTCGGLLSFHNNFVIDCVPGVSPNNNSNAYIAMHKYPIAMTRVRTRDPEDMRGVDITSDIYREKYPYLYDVYKNDARPEWMYYNNMILYKRYKIFVDGENGDFTQVDSFAKTIRDEYDWKRRTDVVMGYEDELVLMHRVDFKSIGLIKKESDN